MNEDCEICGHSSHQLREIVGDVNVKGLAALCNNCQRLVQKELGSISKYPTRSYQEALAAFQQRYWSVLECFRENRDGKCTTRVAHYYFSSGETRALCSDCVNRPDLPSCMRDGKMHISVQYHNEVYALLK